MVAPEVPQPAPWDDITTSSGITFRHTTGATGAFYFPEIAGSGCGLFDFDGDGDLDIYAVQAHPLDPASKTPRQENRLFRNDGSRDGKTREPRFVDVTANAGVGDTGYGMGTAVGDYDNDGDLDLLVTNFGPDVLYRNNGNGTFTDVTRVALPQHAAHAAGGWLDAWSTSASFLDYDLDGDLDIYIAHYVRFQPAENLICHSRSGRRDYCGPETFEPAVDQLWQNNGDGTFLDVSEAAGITGARGASLGVVSADFNGDGLPDIYVAVDGMANHMWVNRGDGTFADEALLSGAAYNADGLPEAGMGVSAGDFDGDGDADILLAHLAGEHNTLLVNDRTGYFDDRTRAQGLGAMSRPFTGFGVRWFDLEGDGDLDFFVANGAVKIAESYADRPYPYANPNQLVRNGGAPLYRFEDISRVGGPAVTLAEVSRGAAFGDIDNDGDSDIVLSNSNGPLRVLRNNAGNGANWLVLQLEGREDNRSAIGAIVELLDLPGPRRVRRVHADGSYLAAHDLRVRFGVLRGDEDYTVRVRWPRGSVERFANLRPGTVQRVVQGRGQRLDVESADQRTVQRPQTPQLPSDTAAPALRTPASTFPEDTLGPAVREQIAKARATVTSEPRNAHAHGRLGMVLHAYELYASAERHYLEALRLAPQQPDWLYYLGLVEIELGELSRAAGNLDAIVTLRPAFVPARLAAGEVHLRMQNLDAAESAFRAVLERTSDDAEVALAECGLGRVTALRGQDERALAHFGQALERQPSYGLAHYGLGQSLRRLGRLDEARQQLQRAEMHRTKEPQPRDPLRQRLDELTIGGIPALHDGIAHLQAGRIDAALPLLRRAVALRPDLAEAHTNLAIALLQSRDLTRAEHHFQKALRIDPGYVQALYNLGVLAHRRGDHATAIAHFENTLRVRPDHFEAHFGLGRNLQHVGRVQDAITHARTATELRPQHSGAAKQWAQRLVEDGRPREALRVLAAAAERMPGQVSLRDRHAWVLATATGLDATDRVLGESRARAVCEQTRWSLPHPIHTLAAALAAQRRYAEAIEYAEQAQTLARESGRAALAAEIAERLAEYRTLSSGE